MRNHEATNIHAYNRKSPQLNMVEIKSCSHQMEIVRERDTAARRRRNYVNFCNLDLVLFHTELLEKKTNRLARLSITGLSNSNRCGPRLQWWPPPARRCAGTGAAPSWVCRRRGCSSSRRPAPGVSRSETGCGGGRTGCSNRPPAVPGDERQEQTTAVASRGNRPHYIKERVHL